MASIGIAAESELCAASSLRQYSASNLQFGAIWEATFDPVASASKRRRRATRNPFPLGFAGIFIALDGDGLTLTVSRGRKNAAASVGGSRTAAEEIYADQKL